MFPFSYGTALMLLIVLVFPFFLLWDSLLSLLGIMPSTVADLTPLCSTKCSRLDFVVVVKIKVRVQWWRVLVL